MSFSFNVVFQTVVSYVQEKVDTAKILRISFKETHRCGIFAGKIQLLIYLLNILQCNL